MANIKIDFINNSSDSNNSQVVIFQNNVAFPNLAMQESAVAWQAIPLGVRNSKHSFTVTENFQLAASDSFGNQTPQLAAHAGNRFDMTSTPSGNKLILNTENLATSNKVEVCNELPTGSMNVMIYKDGKLLAKKTGIAPGQKADFLFIPTIHIGIVPSQIEEGELINLTALSNLKTQISLEGISSADLVLTGGGSGASSVPYVFALENVVKG